MRKWPEQAGRPCSYCAILEPDGGPVMGFDEYEATGNRRWVPSQDHIVPVNKGGTNDPSNLRFVHHICNITKSTLSEEQYLHLRRRLGHRYWEIAHALYDASEARAGGRREATEIIRRLLDALLRFEPEVVGAWIKAHPVAESPRPGGAP